MIHPTRPVAAVFAALALAGCRDAAGVRDPLVGSYVLRAVGGRPLPVVTSSGRGFEGGLEETRTLEQRYDFAADGTVRITTTIRQLSERPPRDTVATFSGELGYWRDGSRVTVGPKKPCPPNALCPANVEGRLIGRAYMRFEFPSPTPTPWEYEAVR